MPITDLPLAKSVRAAIADSPLTFDMGDWVRQNECGTIACIAGHTVLIEGSATVQHVSVCDFDDDLDASLGEDNTVATFCRTADGIDRHIGEYAAELLGLTEVEMHRVFYSGQSRALELFDQLIADAEQAAQAGVNA